MQRESLWEQDLEWSKNEIKQLKGDIRTDVLIIGGGIAGILCAYRLKAAGVSCVVVEFTPIPIRTCGALGMEEQAQFKPMKLLQPLSEKLEIYEKTMVTEIKEGKALTNHGIIQADQIVLATHFPMVNIPGGYFAKMYRNRSYALAVKDGPQIDGMYIDEKEEGFSFRNYQDYLLVGGGGHKTGTKGGGYAVLEKLVSKAYPQKRISFAWSAQDCMTLDGIPYIGRHSKSRSQMFVASGFNKWGMTGAMSAAIVLEIGRAHV